MTILGWIAFGFAVLVAAMLLTLFVLALVFQRLLLALGIVGLLAIGVLMLLGSKYKSPAPAQFPQVRMEGFRKDITIEATDSAREASSSRPAEVSPEAAIVAAADEPKIAGPVWIEQPPRLHGGVYEVAVASGPYVTAGECQHALEAAEAVAVAEYLDDYLGAGAGRLMPLDADFIRERLVHEEFQQPVAASIGPMLESHALLVFDDAVRGELRARWRRTTVEARLWRVGSAAFLVLAALGSAFVYLARGNRRASRAGAASPAAAPP